MPGVKLFDPFVRKPGISVAEFSHHWLTSHAEIVTTIRRITRYVQCRRVEADTPVLDSLIAPGPWDGCAETWHANVSSVAAMVDEPRFEELMADERSFLDLSAPRRLISTEERLVDEHGFDHRVRGVKLSVFVARDASLGRDQFAAEWGAPQDDAAQLGRRLGAMRQVVCAVVGHVQRDAYATGPSSPGSVAADDGYDGVRELWWPDRRALEEGLAAHPELARQLLGPDGVDRTRSATLIGQERVIVP